MDLDVASAERNRLGAAQQTVPRITCSRARSTKARIEAWASVSFLWRLPWWTRWIRSVAFTAATTTTQPIAPALHATSRKP